METVVQGVNWHSASAFLKQKTTFAAARQRKRSPRSPAM